MRSVLVALLAIGLAGSAQAASIEARLIRASNETGKIDEPLKHIQPKLKKVFGYQSYQQIGVQKAPLQEKGALRLNLGEGIVLLVSPKSLEKKKCMLDLEMYSGKAVLVKSTVRIAQGADVLIKGPEVGSALLILSLGVTE